MMNQVTINAESTNRKVKRALKAYGVDNCHKAFRLSSAGEGASSVGIALGLKTNQADAAIDAGRAMAAAAIVAKAEQQEEDDFMWESGFEANDY